MNSHLGIIANVLNQIGTPMMWQGLLANRPAPGIVGRIAFITDTLSIQRDTGTQWDDFETGNVTGSGTPGKLTKFITASSIGDSIVTESGGTLSIAGGVSVTGNVITSANNMYTNGTSAFRWSTIYGVNADFTGVLSGNDGVFTGNLYISNGKTLFGRNAANNAWINLIGISASNRVIIDESGFGSEMGGKLIQTTSAAITAQGQYGYNSVTGQTLYPKAGSSYDFSWLNSAGLYVLRNPTGTRNVDFAGSIILSAAPTTSAAFFDIITRNTATGVIEKITSATVVTGATNGLSFLSGSVELGGTLTKNTTIDTASFLVGASKGSQTFNNSTKYGWIGALSFTTGGTQTNQFAGTGIVGVLTLAASSSITMIASTILSGVWGKTQIGNAAATNTTGGIVSCVSGQPTFYDAGSADFVAGFTAIAPRQESGQAAFTGTVTRYAQYHVPDLNAGTDILARITNMFAFYSAGASDKSYIAGTLNMGTETSISDAMLQISSTTKGFLPSRMTTVQKTALTTEGLVVYDTDLHKLCVRGAAGWETITSV